MVLSTSANHDLHEPKAIPDLNTKVAGRLAKGRLLANLKGYWRRLPVARPMAVRMYTNLRFLLYPCQQGLWQSMFSLSGLRLRMPSQQAILTWDVPLDKPVRAAHLLAGLRGRGLQVGEGEYTL